MSKCNFLQLPSSKGIINSKVLFCNDTLYIAPGALKYKQNIQPIYLKSISRSKTIDGNLIQCASLFHSANVIGGNIMDYYYNYSNRFRGGMFNIYDKLFYKKKNVTDAVYYRSHPRHLLSRHDFLRKGAWEYHMLLQLNNFDIYNDVILTKLT